MNMSALQQRTGQRQQKFFNQNNRFNPNNKKNFRFPNNNKGQARLVQTNGIKPPNRDAVIRANLEHMKQVAQKKRVAQERYYGNGRSPMIKTTSGPFIKQEHQQHQQHSQPNRASIQQRLSVQQRLGNRGRQIQNFNTHPNITNKKTFTSRTNPQFASGMRSDKIVRVQNMQQKKTRFRNPNNGAIKTINSMGKVVYLQPVRRPANYTVRVENDRKHHVNQGLNPVLQQEIKLIQSKSGRQIVAPVAPVPQQHQQQPVQNIVANSYEVDRLPIVATTRTLHERFSMI